MDPKPQKLDYQTFKLTKSSSVWAIVAASLFALVCFIALCMPAPSRSRAAADSVRCASNLRQIGQALLLYSNENHGVYPPSLALTLNEEVEPAALVCPSSTDTAATGPTTQAVMTSLTTPGHCSYVYLGDGLTDKTATASTVVAYEAADNHPQFGHNVLFGDGRVQHVPNAWFKQLEALVKQRGSSTQPVILAPPP